MDREIKYIVNNINKLSIEEKNNICKMLLIYNIELKQCNNGVYIFTKDLDDSIINLIYNSVKSKLN